MLQTAFLMVAVHPLSVAIAWGTHASQRIQFAGETLEL